MSGRTGAFPLIEIKVEPKIITDWSNFVSEVTSIALVHPNVFVTVDAENHEASVGGLSELHIDCFVKELISRSVALKIGAPQVAYRETITRKVTKDYTHKKQTGGTGQYARVILEMEPVQRGAGNSFEARIVNGSVPEEYISSVEKGLNSVLSCGPLNGFPIVDLKVTLIDGAYHDADSSAIAFEIATRAAIREAFETAGAVLLEPIMKVDITLPEECIKSIIGDVHLRRGQIAGISERGEEQVIHALIPLSSMFGYAAQLNSLSTGLANFVMDYSHYQAVNPQSDPENFPPAIGMRA